MASKAEGFFNGYNNCRLHYKVWQAKSAKVALIITHGQSEHADCYKRLVEAISELPISIYAWDLRGHGRSEGQRGYVKNFSDYSEDLRCFINFLKESTEFPTEKMILLGHSMGGLIQLNYLCAQLHSKLQVDFKAQVLSSPLLGFTVEVPFYKDIAALAFRSIMPTLTLNNEINFSDVTRDPAIIQEMESDIMRHDRISPEAYLGAIEAIENLRQEIHHIRLPTLMQIPEQDPIVDSQATQRFFAQMQSEDKLLITYENRKHEIYNDLDREIVYKDLVNFLTKHL